MAPSVWPCSVILWYTQQHTTYSSPLPTAAGLIHWVGREWRWFPLPKACHLPFQPISRGDHRVVATSTLGHILCQISHWLNTSGPEPGWPLPCPIPICGRMFVSDPDLPFLCLGPCPHSVHLGRQREAAVSRGEEGKARRSGMPGTQEAKDFPQKGEKKARGGLWLSWVHNLKLNYYYFKALATDH